MDKKMLISQPVVEERNYKAFYTQTSIICKSPLKGEQIR